MPLHKVNNKHCKMTRKISRLLLNIIISNKIKRRRSSRLNCNSKTRQLMATFKKIKMIYLRVKYKTSHMYRIIKKIKTKKTMMAITTMKYSNKFIIKMRRMISMWRDSLMITSQTYKD